MRARLRTRRSSGKRTLKQTIAKLLGNKMLITQINQSTLSTLKSLNGGRGSADNCSLIRSYNHGTEWISPSVGKNHACIHRYSCSSCTWTLAAYIPQGWHAFTSYPFYLQSPNLSYVCAFSTPTCCSLQSFSQEQIYLCPRSGAVAVTLEWAIGSIGFITQPGHLGGGTNQGAQLWS